jgi:ubiquinone/menaquinone biosynthesis C-methylase UbiE
LSLRAAYDKWHQRVFESEPEHEDASSPWYNLVREQVGPVQGLRVLEVACGRGGFVRELARAGAQVTGCDFSMAALQVGQAKLRPMNGTVRAALVQGDAQSLPFASEVFDIVISCETIEHVPDAQSALSEMWRVSRPGAKLFLTTPNYANLMGLYDLYSRLRHPHRQDDQPFDRRQWIPQIRKSVSAAGWKILHSDGTVHQLPIFPGHNPIQLPSLESNRGVRKLLSPFAYHYFLISEKRVAP